MLDIINRYAHGLVAVPILEACRGIGLFGSLRREGPATVSTLTARLGANAGHLSAALRLLDGLGWVDRGPGGAYRLLPASDQLAAIPSDIHDLISRDLAEAVATGGDDELRPWAGLSISRWPGAGDYLADLLDGLWVIPVWLGLAARDPADPVRAAVQLPGPLGDDVRRLLTDRQWLTRTGDGWSATSTGQHMAERMGITGTVASYRPMLQRTRQLLVGDARAVFERDIAGHEKHLDRTLNVTASGFQHGKYFTDLERALLRVFDDPDLDQQPGYIVDTGCGDGTLLRQLYDAIQSRSLRGRALSSHPLTLIGADLNAQALAATSRTLRGLPHLTVHADINAPAGLLDALA
ncbi:MAG: hypothetical protein ACI9WU_000857, partial [Myxococcota bacterium]